ncbi:uroporphyrinogen-III synthase [Ottowia thiooxydans]|uniref:uroporphyrinogen-III synthase n=1 Tax=Ottowia thiooxydans TaxID=219182 RepID=UPI00048A5D5D|nr:uroporphyrinogen-III synthase [Ottowia thiooxydans]
MPRVIVTRPAKEAERWVFELAARGLEAHALALIGIEPPLETAPLHQARSKLDSYAAVMFVSVNAVSGFMQASGQGGALEMESLAMGPRAWSPGPGTTRALLESGWPASAIDAPSPDAPQFDSESLWDEVQAQASAGKRVLIVRGADAQGQVAGRAWLATQLRAAGVTVEEVAAYRRALPVLGAAQRTLAEAAAADGSVWLFSSSEAIANLCALLPAQDWSHARALATHERIAQTARQAGFGRVTQTRPTLDAVAASIESTE